MARTLRFLHLTDLHIVHPEIEDPRLHSDTAATMREIRRRIEAMSPPPAFIAVSGDLTNHGDVASFRTLGELMSGLDLPIVYALGNHDSRRGFYQGMLGRSHDLDAPYDHDVDIEGLHVITLDTSEPNKIGGTLTDTQFEFLSEALDRHPALPKLIVMHHAPALDFDPEWEWEGLSFAATERLAEMVRGYRIVGILSGHIHQDRVSHWHGIPVIIGMGQHCALDPLFSGDGIRSVSGTSFAVCTLRDSGLTVGFVPLPSDRREVNRTTLADLRAYEDALAARPQAAE